MDADGVTGMMLHVSSDGRRARGGVGGKMLWGGRVTRRLKDIYFLCLGVRALCALPARLGATPQSDVPTGSVAWPTFAI